MSTTMAKDRYPQAYRKAVEGCRANGGAKLKTRLGMSRCIRNSFFKEHCPDDKRDCRTARPTGPSGELQPTESRLDKVRRQRNVHVTSYLLFDLAVPCGGGELRGASCLPSISGHGRVSIDDLLDDPEWPPQASPSGDRDRDQRKKNLLRLALFKDQRAETIRMYWKKARYHDTRTGKTHSLPSSFFTMGLDQWIKTHLPKQSGLGRRIVEDLKTKPKFRKMLQR